MAEMPSIWMLFWPAPPRRVPPAEAPPETTPGTMAVKLVKLPWLIGRFSTCAGRDGEGALTALRLDEGRLGRDVDDLGLAADLDRQAAECATRSPPLTAMPVRRSVRKPLMVTSSV